MPPESYLPPADGLRPVISACLPGVGLFAGCRPFWRVSACLTGIGLFTDCRRVSPLVVTLNFLFWLAYKVMSLIHSFIPRDSKQRSKGRP